MGVIEDDDIHQAGCGGCDRIGCGRSRGNTRVCGSDAGPGRRSRVGPERCQAGKRQVGMWALPMLVASRAACRILWTAPLGRSRLGMARTRMGAGMGAPGLGPPRLGSGLGPAARLASLVIASGGFSFDRQREPVFFCLFQRRDQFAALFRQFLGFGGVASERVRVRQGEIDAA